eukprot:scaffold4.g4859.t1
MTSVGHDGGDDAPHLKRARLGGCGSVCKALECRRGERRRAQSKPRRSQHPAMDADRRRRSRSRDRYSRRDRSRDRDRERDRERDRSRDRDRERRRSRSRDRRERRRSRCARTRAARAPAARRSGRCRGSAPRLRDARRAPRGPTLFPSPPNARAHAQVWSVPAAPAAGGGGFGLAATQQATRHARRIYVGGLPPTATDDKISTFFRRGGEKKARECSVGAGRKARERSARARARGSARRGERGAGRRRGPARRPSPPPRARALVRAACSNALAAVGGTTAGPGPCVVNVYLNNEKKFAFVELRTVEEASNSMALDGIMFEGVTVRIRRPADYNAALAAALGPAMPNPNLNLAAIGLDKAVQLPPPPMAGVAPGSATGPYAPDAAERVFVGGLPYYLNEEQCRELLSAFGAIKSFDLVKDRETGQSKGYGFCVYEDPAVTDVACAGLNGMQMGDRSLTVRRATEGQKQTTGEGAAPAPAVFSAAAARVLKLQGAIQVEELANEEDYNDILEDMREECGKYGAVVALHIPRPGPPGAPPPPGLGKVVVEYDSSSSALAARNALHGRKFGGSVVEAVLMPADAYAAGQRASTPPSPVCCRPPPRAQERRLRPRPGAGGVPRAGLGRRRRRGGGRAAARALRLPAGRRVLLLGAAAPPPGGAVPLNPFYVFGPDRPAWPRGLAPRGSTGAALPYAAPALASIHARGLESWSVDVVQLLESAAPDVAAAARHNGGAPPPPLRWRPPDALRRGEALLAADPSAFAPWNARAALVSARAALCLYLPRSAPAHSADLFRSALAWGMLPRMHGLVAYAAPAAAAGHAAAPAGPSPAELAAEAAWDAAAPALLRLVRAWAPGAAAAATGDAATAAAGLLEAAARAGALLGAAADAELAAAAAFAAALQSAGAPIPRLAPGAAAALQPLPPAASPEHDLLAAIHINHRHWNNIPLWLTMHPELAHVAFYAPGPPPCPAVPGADVRCVSDDFSRR